MTFVNRRLTKKVKVTCDVLTFATLSAPASVLAYLHMSWWIAGYILTLWYIVGQVHNSGVFKAVDCIQTRGVQIVADYLQMVKETITWPNFALQDKEKRAATAGEPIYDVYVNSVAVGRISDSEWAKIHLQVFRDKGLLLLQITNIMWASLRTISSFAAIIPGYVFWMMVLCALYSPETFTQVWAELQHPWAAPALSHFVNSFIHLGILIFIVYMITGIILGYHFGFINYYAKRRGRLLRELCKVPAEGTIEMTHIVINDKNEGRMTATASIQKF